MTTKTVDRGSARERLLAAADQLFYEEGVHSVGIDRVIEQAGVAKASLYNLFGNKDGLVRAYLTARHERRQRRITRHLATLDTPREKILGIYEVLDRLFADPRFRGCAFLNASAEAAPDSCVREISADSRAWVRGLFTELAAEAGAAQPAELGEQLMQLYDGATVAADLDHDRDAAKRARSVAAALVDSATRAA